MFNADLQKWTRVKPKRNQTLAPKPKKNQTLAEEEKKFQELTKKCPNMMEKKLRAALYATGTGSSTTATGTTGQAAATKLHKA